jgi:outer membrane protein
VNKQVGIQINIPIFTGWNNRTPVVRSRVAYENAELDVLFRELQIKSEVYNIYRSFQDFLNAYQASLAQREAAELAVQVQRESYELGIASQVELNQAMQLFVQAETTLASNKYRLIFQRILIDYATGTLSLESMP